MTTFVSFNINSIRLRLHQLQRLDELLMPDVIALQETKVQDKDFPTEALAKMGYHAHFFGQKTHYGVAILSKTMPRYVHKGFACDTQDSQKRFIHAEFWMNGKEIHVLNGYFPQGESKEHAIKFPMKRAFYDHFGRYIQDLRKDKKSLVVMGDMNVAPSDMDVGIGDKNAKRWLARGICSFLPEEREWYLAFRHDLVDTYRYLMPTGDLLSWFDYRTKGFEDSPKRGLRIDHILCTPDLLPALHCVGIDYEVRSMDKPSDHAPVWASFRW